MLIQFSFDRFIGLNGAKIFMIVSFIFSMLIFLKSAIEPYNEETTIATETYKTSSSLTLFPSHSNNSFTGSHMAINSLSK